MEFPIDNRIVLLEHLLNLGGFYVVLKVVVEVLDLLQIHINTLANLLVSHRVLVPHPEEKGCFVDALKQRIVLLCELVKGVGHRVQLQV